MKNWQNTQQLQQVYIWASSTFSSLLCEFSSQQMFSRHIFIYLNCIMNVKNIKICEYIEKKLNHTVQMMNGLNMNVLIKQIHHNQLHSVLWFVEKVHDSTESITMSKRKAILCYSSGRWNISTEDEHRVIKIVNRRYFGVLVDYKKWFINRICSQLCWKNRDVSFFLTFCCYDKTSV